MSSNRLVLEKRQLEGFFFVKLFVDRDTAWTAFGLIRGHAFDFDERGPDDFWAYEPPGGLSVGCCPGEEPYIGFGDTLRFDHGDCRLLDGAERPLELSPTNIAEAASRLRDLLIRVRAVRALEEENST